MIQTVTKMKCNWLDSHLVSSPFSYLPQSKEERKGKETDSFLFLFIFSTFSLVPGMVCFTKPKKDQEITELHSPNFQAPPPAQSALKRHKKKRFYYHPEKSNSETNLKEGSSTSKLLLQQNLFVF